MRVNTPITARERGFPAEQRLNRCAAANRLQLRGAVIGGFAPCHQMKSD